MRELGLFPVATRIRLFFDEPFAFVLTATYLLIVRDANPVANEERKATFITSSIKANPSRGGDAKLWVLTVPRGERIRSPGYRRDGRDPVSRSGSPGGENRLGFFRFQEGSGSTPPNAESNFSVNRTGTPVLSATIKPSLGRMSTLICTPSRVNRASANQHPSF